jgi:hypothetical protein
MLGYVIVNIFVTSDGFQGMFLHVIASLVSDTIISETSPNKMHY